MQSQADIREQLIHWYKDRHSFDGPNAVSAASDELLIRLELQILMPIVAAFGDITITYGFTCSALSRYIKVHAPKGTAPTLDQHACHEINTRGEPICKRAGAACDFWVKGHENDMHQIASFICQHLPFDKLYFYGRNRPIHVSYAPVPMRHLQIMQQSPSGRRIPGKKAFGNASVQLAKEL